MRSFGEYNPIASLCFYAAALAPVMFVSDPVIAAVSLTAAVLYDALSGKEASVSAARRVKGGNSGGGFHLFALLLFVTAAAANPLFVHKGATALFVLNDNPVTLEAALYGVSSAFSLTAALYWCRSFSRVMTGDRLLYLFGSVSPKTALVLSAAMRCVPLFASQARKTEDANRAVGLYRDGSAVDRVRGGTLVLSVLTTWALENGVITADSMTARGYGIGTGIRRAFYSPFRFRSSDAVLLAVTAALFALSVAGIALGAAGYVFYPSVTAPSSPLTPLVYVSYAALAFIPAFTEGEEALKWRCLRSKI